MKNLLSAEIDELTLKLHYHREDGEYADWSVWFWEEGGEGDDYPFQEENGEMVATYTVPAGATSIGYIVRTPDWGKDVNMDQFIDVSAYVSGTVHVYVESGVEGHRVELDSNVSTGTKLKSATYADKKIEVEIASPPADVSDDLIEQLEMKADVNGTWVVTKEGYTMATQKNAELVPGFAFFNDTIRDALKGNVFNNTQAGYVSGALRLTNADDAGTEVLDTVSGTISVEGISAMVLVQESSLNINWTGLGMVVLAAVVVCGVAILFAKRKK